MEVTVLTSIVGGKDSLLDVQPKSDAKWVAYADNRDKSVTWETKRAVDRFEDPRRNSREPKLLSHLFCDTEYSIWIDGNIQLLKDPEELVTRYLKEHDLAVFKHNLRDCIYDEAIKCAKAGLDDPEVIIEQATAYEKAGFPKHKGLYECGMLIRRHTDQVKRFNEAWFAQYCRYSVRDQISFVYTLDMMGMRVNGIDMAWRLSSDGLSGLRGDFVRIVPHKIANPYV